jgi:hypothetical protein
MIPGCVAARLTIHHDAEDQRLGVNVRAPDLVLLKARKQHPFRISGLRPLWSRTSVVKRKPTFPTVASTNSPGHLGFVTTNFSSFVHPHQISTFCDKSGSC